MSEDGCAGGTPCAKAAAAAGEGVGAAGRRGGQQAPAAPRRTGGGRFGAAVAAGIAAVAVAAPGFGPGGAAGAEDLGLGDIMGAPAAVAEAPVVADAPVAPKPVAKLSSKQQRLRQLQEERAKLKEAGKSAGKGAVQKDLGLGDIFETQKAKVGSKVGGKGGAKAPEETADKKFEAPKFNAPKFEAPKVDFKMPEMPAAPAPKVEAPKAVPAPVPAPAVKASVDDFGLGDMFSTPAKKETTMGAKKEAPAPKFEAPKLDFKVPDMPAAPKFEAPKFEAPKFEAPKFEAPKMDFKMPEMPAAPAPKVEAPKAVPAPAPSPSPAPAMKASGDDFGLGDMFSAPAKEGAPALKAEVPEVQVAPAVTEAPAVTSPSATSSLSSKEQRLAQMRAERARMAESSTSAPKAMPTVSAPKPTPVMPSVSKPEAATPMAPPAAEEPQVTEAAKNEALARYEAMRSGSKIKANADKVPIDMPDFSALKNAMPKSLDEIKSFKVPEVPKGLPRVDMSGVQVPDVQLPKVDFQALGLPDVGAQLDGQLTKLLGDKKAIVYALGGAISKLGGDAVGLLRDVYFKADPGTQAKLSAVAAASPALFWVFLAASRGYAGDVDPLEASDSMKKGKAVLIDVRDPDLALVEGRPYIKSKARKNIYNVPFQGQWGSGEEMGLVGDSRSVAAGLLAVRIASLRGVSKGSKVYLIDEKGSENVKMTAKALSGLGFRKVYRVRGGFAQWLRTSGVAIKQAPWGEDAAVDTLREDSEALVSATKEGASKALQSALKKPAKVAVPLGVLVGSVGVYFDAPVPFSGGWRARGFAVLLALLAAATAKARTYKSPQELVNDLAKLPAAAAVLASAAEPYINKIAEASNAAQASIPAAPSAPTLAPAEGEAVVDDTQESPSEEDD